MCFTRNDKDDEKEGSSRNQRLGGSEVVVLVVQLMTAE